MHTPCHPRFAKRVQLLAGAGAALAIMLAATSAQAQTTLSNAAGVRTLANQQTSANGITRADVDAAAIAGIATGPVDGGELEIAGNAVEASARGNDAMQRIDAEPGEGEGQGPTHLSVGRQHVDAVGASVIANHQTTGNTQIVADVRPSELAITAGLVSSSALNLSRNALDALALGNGATSDIALSGRLADGGAGIAGYQGTGGSVAARARSGTALSVGAVSEGALDNSANLDRATAHGNSAADRITAQVTAIVAPAVDAAAASVPTEEAASPTATAGFSVLSSQDAGGAVIARAGDFDEDPAFTTLIDGDADHSAITSNDNALSAGVYGNRFGGGIVIDAGSIGDAHAAAGTIPAAIAKVTSIQRAESGTLVAAAGDGTAITLRGDASGATISASRNSVRTVATANLAGGSLSVRAGSIEASGSDPIGEGRTNAPADAVGGDVASAFGVQNVQAFDRNAVNAELTSRYATASAQRMVEHSMVRVDGNTAFSGATGNDAVNEVDLAATSMAASAAVSNLQSGNGSVSATIGTPDVGGGALIVTADVIDSRLFVTGNGATATAIGSNASNRLTISSASILGDVNPQNADSGAAVDNGGPLGLFALTSRQRLGQPGAEGAAMPGITSAVFGETGIIGRGATDGSSLAVSGNAQRANALGNTSANAVQITAATLDNGATASLSALQYARAEVTATSGAKLTAPGTLDDATLTLTGNSSTALAAINDTDNSLAIEAGRIGNIGAGTVELAAAPVGEIAASGDYVVTNQQFAEGSVGAIAVLQLGDAGSRGELRASRITMSDNVATAEASANRARNTVSLSVNAADIPGTGVANLQINAASASASALTNGGQVLADPATVAIDSSITIARNGASALARGNAAENTFAISAALTGSPQPGVARTSPLDAGALAPAAILNTQSNHGAVTATANDTSFGEPLNAPGAVGRSRIDLTGNAMAASAFGNTASNVISVSTLGQAPGTVITNVQANYGNVSALVRGSGHSEAPGSMSGGALSITGNQLSAVATGNQVSSAITTPR